MNRTVTGLFACFFCIGLAHASDAPAPDPNAAEAKQIIQEFFSQLKGELQAAMKAGGPPNAVQVCQKRAPAIAQDLSQKTGWDVARTSLKLRNPANRPDDWELAVLNKFEERKAAGEDPAQIAYGEVVEQDGKKAFRFMKAIPTAELCLSCHGSELSPELQAQLDKLYPTDQARGYSLGEIRGAFTLAKPL